MDLLGTEKGVSDRTGESSFRKRRNIACSHIVRHFKPQIENTVHNNPRRGHPASDGLCQKTHRNHFAPFKPGGLQPGKGACGGRLRIHSAEREHKRKQLERFPLHSHICQKHRHKHLFGKHIGFVPGHVQRGNLHGKGHLRPSPFQQGAYRRNTGEPCTQPRPVGRQPHKGGIRDRHRACGQPPHEIFLLHNAPSQVGKGRLAASAMAQVDHCKQAGEKDSQSLVDSFQVENTGQPQAQPIHNIPLCADNRLDDIFAGRSMALAFCRILVHVPASFARNSGFRLLQAAPDSEQAVLKKQQGQVRFEGHSTVFAPADDFPSLRGLCDGRGHMHISLQAADFQEQHAGMGNGLPVRKGKTAVPFAFH